ncbi:DUF551 domain-containing protein [Enterobacter hormaechei]|uniref:DUF551 domain-containing protein n=1 Tax=Enterobacter hormaechei TaxID=158836 RepID=UPI001E4B925A|nr:DUF551 domain-containing protein [Enterobacter hormaechei]MCC4519008.1 DUF551 domain-containing protein [Enterobacter hormaechei]MCC4543831.1 DUF551 domain-containing protein [Enterobacter hormaechei]MCC4550406.1 DUF551 domain-containing protein [Enterobacter hormaechei]
MIIITREQAKDLRNAFQCWQQDYDPEEDKEQYDMFGLGMVAMDALLASLEAESKSQVAIVESPDIPPVEPNWNDPTLREPGIWAYGFLEGQKAILRQPQPEPSTDSHATPALISVPDDIRLLKSEVTIWKDRWELLRELFREVADALGCDVKDNQAMLDKIEMLQGAEPVSNRDELPDGWVACSERMPERDVDVQVYCADKKEQMVGYMERNEQDGYFRFASLPNGGGVYCQPTHWMPLPSPPAK